SPHRQIDRRALDHFIEVHVPAIAAGISCPRSSRCRRRRRRHTPQHGPQRHRIILQVLRRLFHRRHTARRMQVPSHTFSCILHFHRSEEHTSELQSLRHLVCRLLLEKKKKNTIIQTNNQQTHSIHSLFYI